MSAGTTPSYGVCEMGTRGVHAVVTRADKHVLVTDQLAMACSDGNLLTLGEEHLTFVPVTYELVAWSAERGAHVGVRVDPPRRRA